MNYAVQYNALQTRYSELVTLLRQVLRILAGVAAVPASAGALRRAVALLATELGDDSEGSDAEEEEAAEVDMDVDPNVAVLVGAISGVRNAPVAVQSAPGFLAFSGRIYRLA